MNYELNLCHHVKERLSHQVFCLIDDAKVSTKNHLAKKSLVGWEFGRVSGRVLPFSAFTGRVFCARGEILGEFRRDSSNYHPFFDTDWTDWTDLFAQNQ
jgi:hypothetical protein